MRTIQLFIFLFLSHIAACQDYWQQEVNYTIEVKLDDELHRLHGFESFEYVNNSPQSLSEIYIHLWPNAYKNGETALGKQQYSGGEQLLKFGDEKLKGWIDSLDFKIGGRPVTWSYDDEHIDICKLTLPIPLKPGERVTVTTPFRVQIPSGAISRLGHIEQSYQITQWYPKPAVFDKNGWHQMPYLNQGEFYSEFGSFDVSITLPKNYVLGATGDCQTESELIFLTEKAKETQAKIDANDYNQKSKRGGGEIPASSTEWKTVRYKQDKVHDFAWFCDKRYEVLKGEVELPQSKRKVTSWALFTPNNMNLWKDAIEYINDGTFYYSQWNGDYPYNNVTAVDGTISAGGGMEYPTITVIGNASSAKQLEIVIVHEVGHNWFYGILGSNERDHGWMDEGMNTLNEVRYMQTKYPENAELSDMILGGAFHFNDLSHFDMGDLSYRAIASIGLDQPIETKSIDFTSGNYGIIMYQKTGLVFNYLRQYLGSDSFDDCMHRYYETWKFKHPQPEDMRTSLESCTGKNLDWLFNDLIQTTNHIDYKLKKVKKTDVNTYEVTVKNVGQVDGPISIHQLSNDSILSTTWIEPGQKKSTIVLPASKIHTDRIAISADHAIPEINRQNNSWKSTGLFHRFEKPTMEFLIGDNQSNRSTVFWTPIIAGNFYDKVMLGAAFHNYGVPFNKFQYLVAPMYSFGRNSVSGITELSYSMLPKESIRLSKIGVSVKSFKNDSTFKRNDSYYFIVSPYWTAKLGNRKNQQKPTRHSIRVQSMYRADILGGSNTQNVGGFVEYNMDYVRPDHKVNVKMRNDFVTNIDNSDQFGRSSLSASYAYRYLKNKKSHWVSLRGFVGGFWDNHFKTSTNQNYTMSIAGMNGTQDIFVEDYYFGRGLPTGIWSQQRADNNMGGFSSTTNFGATDQWMATGNFYFQLPIRPNVFGVFADFGTVRLGNTNYSLFNTGLALRLGDVFGVYFPIYMSDILENSYLTKNYTERIRFSLKINLFMKDLKLGNLL